MAIKVEDIRNIAIVGHGSAGKDDTRRPDSGQDRRPQREPQR